MRWVSRAIWTRVLPVSCSFSPNLATISRVCSVLSVVMRRRRIQGSGRDGPGLLDIAAHLLDEVVDAREAPLAAQPLEELDRELFAVQIAVPVDQVGLDELMAAGLELRAHADVDRRGNAVGPRGVDTVARDDEALRRDEVRRREAELAAALVAVHHLAGHGERRAQQLAGVLDGPTEHQAADVARRDDLAVDLEQRLDVDLETAVGAQPFGV